MQDHVLYQRIAGGVAPWTVGEIKVEEFDQRVEVQVTSDDTLPQRCPDCNGMFLVCGHGDEQTWRQPDINHWQILLLGRVPLVNCPEHGIVRVSPPWADWYTRGLDNSLLGPWSLQQLKVLLDAERISPSTLLKRGSSDKWVITGTISALFVKQDEAVEPALSADELEAVDWAIENEPVFFLPYQPTVSDDIATEDHAAQGDASRYDGSSQQVESDDKPHRDRSKIQAHLTGFFRAIPARTAPRAANTDNVAPPPSVSDPVEIPKAPKPHHPEPEAELRLVEDSDRDASRYASKPKPARPAAPKKPAPRSLQRLRKPPEPSPSEWGMAIGQAVDMKHKGVAIPKPPADEAAESDTKTTRRRGELVRRRGFQQGFGLLTMAYLVNSCLMSTLFPAVCMIFFSRLLLLSTSVFAPFGGGNDLQEGQLVACGVSALCLLVLAGFPVWHLYSNDGVLWHYVPSALVGMTVGFALPPEYLNQIFVAIQWCEITFGIVAVALTAYTLSAVPSRSRMSIPIIAAGLLTAVCVMVLFGIKAGSMLTFQADAIPPQFHGAPPDAGLYVIGLCGILICIPIAFLFELYRHTAYETRQFIIRSGTLLGMYLVAGSATLNSFTHAGSDFFDVPLALVPLACINALSAAIPSTLLLVDPQYSVSDD